MNWETEQERLALLEEMLIEQASITPRAIEIPKHMVGPIALHPPRAPRKPKAKPKLVSKRRRAPKSKPYIPSKTDRAIAAWLARHPREDGAETLGHVAVIVDQPAVERPCRPRMRSVIAPRPEPQRRERITHHDALDLKALEWLQERGHRK